MCTFQQILAQTEKETGGAGTSGSAGSSSGGASLASGLSETTPASLRPAVNDSHVQQVNISLYLWIAPCLHCRCIVHLSHFVYGALLSLCTLFDNV